MAAPKVFTAFPSASRNTAGAVNGDLVTNSSGWRGCIVVIDVTAATATPSVVFTVQGYDPVSGKYYTILASAAITGIGTTVLRVMPGLVAVANTHANDLLPQKFRIIATHGDTDAITYSVSVHGVP